MIAELSVAYILSNSTPACDFDKYITACAMINPGERIAPNEWFSLGGRACIVNIGKLPGWATFRWVDKGHVEIILGPELRPCTDA